MAQNENPNRVLRRNPFPLTNTKAPKSEINKPFHSKTLPEEPRPFVSRTMPEANPNGATYKGVDSRGKDERRKG